jgi:hypothetical protein
MRSPKFRGCRSYGTRSREVDYGILVFSFIANQWGIFPHVKTPKPEHLVDLSRLQLSGRRIVDAVGFSKSMQCKHLFGFMQQFFAAGAKDKVQGKEKDFVKTF